MPIPSPHKRVSPIRSRDFRVHIERLFRSLKTEWIPTVGYMNAALAKQDIGRFLMERYNWRRPHQFIAAVKDFVRNDREALYSFFVNTSAADLA